jgi:para-nitrobenzyl esterase
MVTTGTPATGVLADWRPYDADDRSTALFDVVPRVQFDPAAERRRAWEETVARVS